MIIKPKLVTLFGRRMRRSVSPSRYQVGNAVLEQGIYKWRGRMGHHETEWLKSPHAADRALERKIESQWKRLGKLMGKEGKTNAR